MQYFYIVEWLLANPVCFHYFSASQSIQHHEILLYHLHDQNAFTSSTFHYIQYTSLQIILPFCFIKLLNLHKLWKECYSVVVLVVLLEWRMWVLLIASIRGTQVYTVKEQSMPVTVQETKKMHATHMHAHQNINDEITSDLSSNPYL